MGSAMDIYINRCQTPYCKKAPSREDIKNGYMEVPCNECEGSGYWGFGPPGTEGDCVDCKGTGKRWVNL